MHESVVFRCGFENKMNLTRVKYCDIMKRRYLTCVKFVLMNVSAM